MGLDNGIVMYTRKLIDLDNPAIKPEYVTVCLNEYGKQPHPEGYEYEICYWRKCYGLRKRILRILDETVEEDGTIVIEKPKIIARIQDMIIHYLCYPHEWENSIWTMDEIKSVLAQNIINLGWLYDYMINHQGERFIVEFYDSY